MKQIKQINFGLIFVLLLILALRIPTFTEPYWYGDEGIYLVLGQAIQRGAILYRDIWDNKTPLLYWIYTIYPTLLWAKISATLFVLGTIVGVYKLTRVVIPAPEPESIQTTSRSRIALRLSGMTSWVAFFTSLLVGLFLSIPLLEGNIANAELYFTLPIVWGGYFMFKNVILVREEQAHPESLNVNNLEILDSARMTTGTIIGFLLFTAFLFKVPAAFDFIGFFLAYTIISMKQFSYRGIKLLLAKQFKFYLPIVLTFTFAFLLLTSYFLLTHTLKDFITAAFLQNRSYIAIDSGPLSKLSNPLFIKGLFALFASFILFILFIKNKISKELLFLSFWFIFSLYGALLSNRPYMHYLLQIVPPIMILLFYLLINFKKYFYFLIPLIVVFYSLSVNFKNAFFLTPISYYENWYQYVTFQKTWEDYVNYFDPRTLNSYGIASYIINNTLPSDPIFVWGDASFVYVLSNRPPATKFIQAHHLTTIDPKNYDLIVNQLEEKGVKYILVSRPVKFPFLKLEDLLKRGYQKAAAFEDMYVYRKI